MGIEVLGPIRLSTSTGAPVEVPERKVRLLLAALVAAGGKAVAADALIDRVWGEQLPKHPERVLRAKLSVLRACLDQVKPGLRDRLSHGPSGYTLSVDPSMIDAEQFTADIARARRMPSAADRATVLGEAIGLWRGHAYSDVADQLWLAPVIEALHEARLGATEIRAEALLEAGNPASALEIVEPAITEHPLRERLAGALMLALYQLGRQQEALESFDALRRRLAEDLGADPTPSLRELHARILRHDPTLAPRADTENEVAHGNLPAATTQLIGRTEETSQILELLEESRLVTLTGVGGVGKTRLALHAAESVRTWSDRAVWWIDLGQLTAGGSADASTTGEQVAGLVVTALGLADDRTSKSGTDRLAEVFADRPVMLVLDNAEHVLAESSAFVGQMLSRASGPVIMATSRQALGRTEEQRFEVGALSTVAFGEASDAAQFFIARARATDPVFNPHAVNMAVIEQLCQRLDGLPLALELAAGRVKGLSVCDLLKRLSDRLDLLARPSHGQPHRQQTLRATIDWSWSLLQARQQTLLRRLAVHPGSWSLSAIEAISAQEPAGPGEVLAQNEVVDALIGLVDQSMVTTISTGSELRYVLLESIRLYCAERLWQAGEHDDIRRRHRSYFRKLAQEQDPRLRGPDQREALARFNAENAHLDHAFDGALADDDGAEAVALVVATFWYRWITEHLGRLHERLTAAIKASGPRDSAYATAVTLATCMNMARQSGDQTATVTAALDLFHPDDPARDRAQWFAGANLLAIGDRKGEELLDTAVDSLRDHDQEWHVVMAVTQRDVFLVSQWAEAPRGLPDGRDLIEAARATGDRHLELSALHVPQRVAGNALELERSAALAEQALEISVELGFIAESSMFTASTAVAAAHRGDTDDADTRVQRARALAATIGDQFGRASADYAEAIIARQAGESNRARTLLDSWRRDAYIFQADPGAHIEHGHLSILESDIESAAQVIHHLHPLITSGSRPRLTARLLELCAAIHQASGANHTAALTLGVADAHRSRTEKPRTVIENADVTRLWALLSEHQHAAHLEDHYQAGIQQQPGHALSMFSSWPEEPEVKKPADRSSRDTGRSGLAN